MIYWSVIARSEYLQLPLKIKVRPGQLVDFPKTDYSLVRTDWDIDRYCDFLSKRQSGRNVKAEAELMKKFPPPFSHGHLLEYPALITDRHGIAMVWYLPGLLTSARHNTLWATIPTLEPHLIIKSKSKNWRVGPEFFKPPGLCKLKPGSVSLSPAWFHQGYTVSCVTLNKFVL